MKKILPVLCLQKVAKELSDPLLKSSMERLQNTVERLELRAGVILLYAGTDPDKRRPIGIICYMSRQATSNRRH